MEGLLDMNNKERERLKTLVRLTDKTLNQRLAAKQLGIGTWQVQRWLKTRFNPFFR